MRPSIVSAKRSLPFASEYGRSDAMSQYSVGFFGFGKKPLPGEHSTWKVGTCAVLPSSTT